MTAGSGRPPIRRRRLAQFKAQTQRGTWGMEIAVAAHCKRPVPAGRQVEARACPVIRPTQTPLQWASRRRRRRRRLHRRRPTDRPRPRPRLQSLRAKKAALALVPVCRSNKPPDCTLRSCDLTTVGRLCWTRTPSVTVMARRAYNRLLLRVVAVCTTPAQIPPRLFSATTAA